MFSIFNYGNLARHSSVATRSLVRLISFACTTDAFISANQSARSLSSTICACKSAYVSLVNLLVVVVILVFFFMMPVIKNTNGAHKHTAARSYSMHQRASKTPIAPFTNVYFFQPSLYDPFGKRDTQRDLSNYTQTETRRVSCSAPPAVFDSPDIAN